AARRWQGSSEFRLPSKAADLHSKLGTQPASRVKMPRFDHHSVGVEEPAHVQDGKIRVAIIGVGNCASSLVQGVEYYKNADPNQFVPGLMHVVLGGYHIRDIEFTAAFDIDVNKVGKDLSEAIFTRPNNTIKFDDVPFLGV